MAKKRAKKSKETVAGPQPPAGESTPGEADRLSTAEALAKGKIDKTLLRFKCGACSSNRYLEAANGREPTPGAPSTPTHGYRCPTKRCRTRITVRAPRRNAEVPEELRWLAAGEGGGSTQTFFHPDDNITLKELTVSCRTCGKGYLLPGEPRDEKVGKQRWFVYELSCTETVCPTRVVLWVLDERKGAGEAEQAAESGPDRQPPDPQPTAGSGLRPGRLLAQRRYLIHKLLGKGSMGEVYSADDRTSGSQVALKFLPPELRNDAAQARLANEVTRARKVSHPNVCRVHESGSIEEGVFLSMELIDGETLKAVLERSHGQLSLNEKLCIAHDLCDGLAAIHREGIVHGDLKPGNIILEHSGRAIITDFGLATGGGLTTHRWAGTPGYVAPEHVEAGGSTFQGDLYALGRVLREVFDNGRRRPSETPLVPATNEAESRLREIVLRCLEDSPADRPASAEEVSRRLPPRPSLEPLPEEREVPPETLLVHPRFEAKPGKARVLFGIAVLALALVPVLVSRTQLASQAELPYSPEVLTSKAREHLADLGYGEPPEHYLQGFSFLPNLLPVGSGGEGAGRQLQPLQFWYRQSPGDLVPLRLGSAFRTYGDPPASAIGTVGVHLDTRGRLRALEAVTEAGLASQGGPEPEWPALFAAAGLDSGSFREVPPRWTPPVFAEHRKAWVETQPAPGEPALRVEAAASQGRPVALRMTPERAPSEAQRSSPARYGQPTRWLARLVAGLWFFAVLSAALYLASKNLQEGSADRRAAFRLALSILGARFLVGVLGAEHQLGLEEIRVLHGHLAQAILAAALVWIIHVALEPKMRTWWPEQTATWVRAIYGRWRDPQVGQDLLVGTLFGLGAVLAVQLYSAASGWLGVSIPRPDLLGPLTWQVGLEGYLPQLEALRGFRESLAVSVFALVQSLLVTFFAVVGVALLRKLLGEPSLSRGLALLGFTVILYPFAGDSMADLVAALVAGAAWLIMLIRFGFLTAVTATGVAWLLASVPLTFDPRLWYAPGAAVALLAVLALAIFGLVISLEKRSVLSPGFHSVLEGGSKGPPPEAQASEPRASREQGEEELPKQRRTA